MGHPPYCYVGRAKALRYDDAVAHAPVLCTVGSAGLQPCPICATRKATRGAGARAERAREDWRRRQRAAMRHRLRAESACRRRRRQNSDGAEERHEPGIGLRASDRRTITIVRAVLFCVHRARRHAVVQRAVRHARVLGCGAGMTRQRRRQNGYRHDVPRESNRSNQARAIAYELHDPRYLIAVSTTRPDAAIACAWRQATALNCQPCPGSVASTMSMVRDSSRRVIANVTFEPGDNRSRRDPIALPPTARRRWPRFRRAATCRRLRPAIRGECRR